MSHMVKLYRLFDLQDETNERIVTLMEAKEWLRDFWNFNPDEEMTDEEHSIMIDEIMKSDVGELCDRLWGVDYHIKEVD